MVGRGQRVLRSLAAEGWVQEADFLQYLAHYSNVLALRM
jgi:hypothetical protein